MGAVQAQDPGCPLGYRLRMSCWLLVLWNRLLTKVNRSDTCHASYMAYRYCTGAMDARACREYQAHLSVVFQESMSELSQEQCGRAFDVLGMRSGGRSLTVAELEPYFAERNLPHAARQLHAYVLMAENSRLVRSGRLRGTKTYALIDERIAP